MRFIRRPLIAGETGVPVFSQPTMRGNVPGDTTTGEVPGLALPADLVVETESMGGIPITVTIPVNSTMTDIVALVHAALDAASDGFAEQQEGCLVLGTNGVGEGAFVRIQLATNDYDADGFPDDAAPALGLPQDPDPLGTVYAGDVQSSAIRAATQANPEGTRFLAQGEDRTAAAYNRALSQLAGNADFLYTQAKSSVAVPTIVELDATADAARFTFDADGFLEQIDLTDLETLDPSLDGRFFVGNLSRTSTLEEISRYWNVLDTSQRQLLGWDDTWDEPRRAVRVACVTRGSRGAVVPTFVDESSAPAAALLDTQDLTPAVDGRNALGVSRLKIDGLTIATIRRRTGVVVTLGGADGFITSGVVAGDVAVIVGAGVDVPFNHSGTYLVEHVVSEVELVLRPVSTDDLDALNPDDAATYGTFSVYSGGSWEKDVFITLDPPLARFPEDGKIRIVVGMERALGEVADAQLAYPGVRDASEVSAFVSQQLWNRQSLGGAYEGMAKGKGGGFYAEVSNRPPTFAFAADALPDEGLFIRGPYAGEVVDGDVLVADPADTFILSDVGCTVRVTGVADYPDEEHLVVSEFIDGAHVKLVGPPERMGTPLPTETVTYSVYQAAVVDLPAAERVVMVDVHGSPASSQFPHLGHLVQREQTNKTQSPPQLRTPGRGYLHLERAKRANSILAGLPVNIVEMDVASFVGGNVLEIGFNPEFSHTLRPEQGGDTKSVDGYQVAPSIVRILNGPQAGYYRLDRTQSTAGNYLELLYMDGTPPVFVDPGFTVLLAVYNLVLGTNVPLMGAYGTNAVTAAVSIYADGSAQDDDFTVGLGVAWDGEGSAIYSVLNNPEFLTGGPNNVGASGYHTYVKGWKPAHGAWYEFEAEAAGTTAERSVRTFTALGTSYYNDMTQLGSPLALVSDPYAWGAWLHQGGTDPALILTRGGSAGAGPGPVEVTGVPTAIVSVQDLTDGDQRGLHGEAINTHGAVYNAVGGVHSASGVGAHSWVSSIFDWTVDPNAQQYWNDTPYTELGAAGQILPADSSAASLPGHLNVPNYTRFPGIPHHGVLRTTNADALLYFDMALSKADQYKFLGHAVEIDGGDTYTIVGAESVDGITAYLALHAGAGGAVVLGDTLEDFRVLGRRWFKSHIDIADWFQVGTGLLTAVSKRWEAPLHTAGQFLYETYGRVDPAGAGVLVTDTEGALTPHQHLPVEGAGLSKEDVTLLPGIDDTPANFLALSAWNTRVSPTMPAPSAWQTPWTVATGQPRAPFGNIGLFSVAHPGSLLVDDIAIEDVAGGTPVTSNWAAYYGGCVAVYCTGAVAGATHTARAWLRGVRGVPTNLYALRARLVIQWDTGASNTKALVLALRKDDGTVVATHAAGTAAADSKPRLVEYDFTLADIYELPSDGVSDASLFDEGLHLTLDIPTRDYHQAANPIRVILLSLEPIGRPHRIAAPLDVHGTIRAHSLRYMSPVKGYQPISPVDVDLLQNTEYARLYGNRTTSADLTNPWYGVQEGKDVGLIEAGGSWYRPSFRRGLFFRKGLHSASITGYHPFFDPLWYVYITQAGGPAVDPTRLVLPGMTGFHVPLNPPHGSRLSSLHYGLSFSPCFFNGNARFQVWRKNALDLFSSTYVNWTTAATWGGYEGVAVKLYRYNTLNFGVSMQDDYPGDQTATYGFAEVLWTGEIDLSGDVESSFSTNVAAAAAGSGAGDFYSAETFKRGGHDLVQEVDTAAINDPACLIADRRHYGYFLAFEFFIGMRNLSGGSDTYDYSGDGIAELYWDAPVSEIQIAAETGHHFPAQQVGGPMNDDTTYPWAPVVKFRGARLGWVTDRGGHGGWG